MEVFEGGVGCARGTRPRRTPRSDRTDRRRFRPIQASAHPLRGAVQFRRPVDPGSTLRASDPGPAGRFQKGRLSRIASDRDSL